MTHAQVMRAMQSIGKRCFVNCFDAARRLDGHLSDDQIIKNDAGVGTDTNGLATRKSCIRRIFQAKAQCQALQLCFEIRGNPASENKAKRLYQEHC